jgi:hypothetical protein
MFKKRAVEIGLENRVKNYLDLLKLKKENKNEN